MQYGRFFINSKFPRVSVKSEKRELLEIQHNFLNDFKIGTNSKNDRAFFYPQKRYGCASWMKVVIKLIRFDKLVMPLLIGNFVILEMKHKKKTLQGWQKKQKIETIHVSSKVLKG